MNGGVGDVQLAIVGLSLGVKECWARENSVNCRTFNYKTRPLGGEGGTVEQFQSKYIHTIASQCRRPTTNFGKVAWWPTQQTTTRFS